MSTNCLKKKKRAIWATETHTILNCKEKRSENGGREVNKKNPTFDFHPIVQNVDFVLTGSVRDESDSVLVPKGGNTARNLSAVVKNGYLKMERGVVESGVHKGEVMVQGWAYCYHIVINRQN